jgi:hypothetical protein
MIPAELTVTDPAVFTWPVPIAVPKAEPEIKTKAPAIVANLIFLSVFIFIILITQSSSV